MVILFFPYFRVIHRGCIQKSTFAGLKYYRCALSNSYPLQDGQKI
jgi:hypothetical protein